MSRAVFRRIPNLVATVLLTAAAAPLSAQEDAWDWTVSPYLWATGIDGSTALGPARAVLDIGFSDIIDVLDGAALVHVETSKGRNALFGDLVYLSVTPEDRVDFDTKILEAGYLRRFASGTLGSG